jgi:hypothetical protein
LEALFVQSWDIYLQAKDKQACLITLKALIDMTLNDESMTAPVAMALAMKSPMSPPNLLLLSLTMS